MTRTAAMKAMPSHEYVREKIVAIAMAGEMGVLQFTGDGVTPGCVYRDEDVTVVWTGGLTCVAIPSAGPSLTLPLVEDGEDHADLIERICDDAEYIFRIAADAYRLCRYEHDLRGH